MAVLNPPFSLAPNSSSKVVTIEGKTDEPEDDWINISVSFEGSKGSLTKCVNAGTAPAEYEYFVHVEEVGTLDPRADVEN